ncbi:pilus assembly PilX family protein [Spartinivicinus poritis]|uniref:Pilus assembly PilX N-terminal domain-containing protein n=1 Tax=Spartinivicinus poritis TaxID=2994640 RepID=A0ABT5U2E9_9GAMM|nr:pilus assembly PilX N-terminal domain-containing protein [Spartinivicinus sp. A2-2]MDE1460535.1 pilus assembly PilX N-terminal domain-containing protein [Spartinivicinus sp. A2-2]
MNINTQQGSSLIVSLVLLTIFTIIGLAAISTSSLEETMAGNTQRQLENFQVALSELDSQIVRLLGDTTDKDLVKAIDKANANKTGTKEQKTYEFTDASQYDPKNKTVYENQRGIHINSSVLYNYKTASIGPSKKFTNSADIKEGYVLYHFDLNANTEMGDAPGTTDRNIIAASRQTYGFSYKNKNQNIVAED